MIDKIKQDIEQQVGKKVHVLFNSGRNKIEECEGIIAEAYKFIFVVKVDNDLEELRTFTYADILTETVKINFM